MIDLMSQQKSVVVRNNCCYSSALSFTFYLLCAMSFFSLFLSLFHGSILFINVMKQVRIELMCSSFYHICSNNTLVFMKLSLLVVENNAKHFSDVISSNDSMMKNTNEKLSMTISYFTVEIL